MADLSVTIGADTTELEKNLKKAGKTIKKELGGENQYSGGINFATDLMAGKVGSAIGSLMGKVGGEIGGFIDLLIGKSVELMERSREFRNLSIATGLSVKELEGLENLGKTTGVSLNSLANSFAEFNVKVATSKIKGSELNNVFAKMHINFQDVINGTFTATDGLKALADSYTAGTDEQTLAYYGNLMYGSSFKDLLPIVKQGSVAINTQTQLLYKSTKAYDDANAATLNYFTNLKNSFLNFFSDIFGAIFYLIERVRQRINEVQSQFRGTEEKVKSFISNNPTLSSKELLEKAKNKENISPFFLTSPSDKDQKEFINELKKQAGGNGIKLSPFGQYRADAANSMQQMAGGDIFGAVAFSPLERIANATEETAKNTAPQNKGEEVKSINITNINAQ